MSTDACKEVIHVTRGNSELRGLSGQTVLFEKLCVCKVSEGESFISTRIAVTT